MKRGGLPLLLLVCAGILTIGVTVMVMVMVMDKGDGGLPGVVDASAPVLAALKARDMKALSDLSHPQLGVRFSAYGFVDVDKDIVLKGDQIKNLLEDAEIRQWGSFDGSGEPIALSGAGYYDDFVYDVDFAAPQVMGINTIVSSGNTLVNIDTAYPQEGVQYLECHFKGFDPQYEGIDWKSLVLVFAPYKGKLMLIGIVHMQWTI